MQTNSAGQRLVSVYVRLLQLTALIRQKKKKKPDNELLISAEAIRLEIFTHLKHTLQADG